MAVYISLSSDIITPQLIGISGDFLHKYVKNFENLYGLRYCSINIHQFLHFPTSVQRLGPLWTHTCFEYEDLNGQLLRLIHDTIHIDTQLTRSHDQFIRMIRFIEMLPDAKIKDVCLANKCQVKIIEKILEVLQRRSVKVCNTSTQFYSKRIATFGNIRKC